MKLLMYVFPLLLVTVFSISCDDLPFENSNGESGYDLPLKPNEKDSLQSLLRKALKAKSELDTITEERLLVQLLKASENKSRLEYWAANYHLGQLEYKRQNYRKAISYYNMAHLIDPTDLEIYHRANAYYAIGKFDSARQDYNKTIKFVKQDFVREFPNSRFALCDTCGFPFGSKEYEIFTQNSNEPIIDLIKRLSKENLILKEVYDDIKPKKNISESKIKPK